MPYDSATASFIAEVIAKAVNEKKSDAVVRTKGIEALADDKVRLSYIVFGDDKDEIKKFIEGAVQDGANQYFKQKAIEEESRGFIDKILAIGFNVPGSDLSIQLSQINEAANRFIVSTGKMGQDLLKIIRALPFGS